RRYGRLHVERRVVARRTRARRPPVLRGRPRRSWFVAAAGSGRSVRAVPLRSTTRPPTAWTACLSPPPRQCERRGLPDPCPVLSAWLPSSRSFGSCCICDLLRGQGVRDGAGGLGLVRQYSLSEARCLRDSDRTG